MNDFIGYSHIKILKTERIKYHCVVNIQRPQIVNHFQLIKSFVLTLIILGFFTSCSKEDLENDAQLTNISVKLKTVTSELNKVYIDIEDVQIKIKQDGNSLDAWLSLEAINKGIHNTSNLNNQSALLLVDNFSAEAGNIYGIRLVLGDNNFMDIDNVLHSLDVSNLGNSYPTNTVSTQLEANKSYDFVIELNVDQSISYDESSSMMVFNPKIQTEIRQFQY